MIFVGRMKIEECDVVEAEMPACSAEWSKSKKQLAIGCYELVDGTTSERGGKLEFYKIEDKKLIKDNDIK